MSEEVRAALEGLLNFMRTSDGQVYVGKGRFSHVATPGVIVSPAEQLRRQAAEIEGRDAAMYRAARLLEEAVVQR